MADFALTGLGSLKEELGITTVNEDQPVINTQATAEQARIERQESFITNTENREGTLTIENNTGNEATLDGNFSDNEVKLSGTQGF